MGMVRFSVFQALIHLSSPHVRGDGPAILSDIFSADEFSPRAWGWSAADDDKDYVTTVLPTCVGMVRTMAYAISVPYRSPHVRGDGPRRAPTVDIASEFSPRAWGWSDHIISDMNGVAVLPTCVGMVRPRSVLPGSPASSPHVRGDGPSSAASLVVVLRFSPRAWGWSVVRWLPL